MLPRSLRFSLRLVAVVLVPVLLLETGRCLWGASFSWKETALHLAFVIAVVLVGAWTQPKRLTRSTFLWPGFLIVLGAILLGAGLWLFVPTVDTGGWFLLVGCYGALMGVDGILTLQPSRIRAWLLRLLIAVVAGALPVVLAQIETRFSDEEFFVAVQLLMLSLVWLVLRSASAQLQSRMGRCSIGTVCVRRGALAVLFVLGVSAGAAYLVRAYQSSFYVLEVPQYPGISSDTPFLCGEVASQSAEVEGVEVFNRLMTLVAENPNKGVSEYGMLALGTGSMDWAQEFRTTLLAEAEQNRFAGPAGSVKYQQYLAAFRLYYFLNVREAFPDLFTPAEYDLLEQWFNAINQRTLTVEWVDWMYGLAFSKWPEGPYENQETGLALLSLMELGDTSTPELSRRNQAFLQLGARGWQWRFRNTDDAFAYQPEWITNAYYQALQMEDVPQQALSQSFEWLLLQLVPGGTPLGYNHPSTPHLGGILYLGAELLRDPRYVWLADQYLSQFESLGKYPSAQPGVDNPVTILGHPPQQGSCLLYGDSGLPTQKGPLAPDKVVLRDGWDEDDTYVLLNLRFSGWHRYKATSVVSRVHWRGPLVVEVLNPTGFDWLPEGRSLFRDKRIPRENLNGLVVERTGMGAVVHSLTGQGGEWAQDPPTYSEVLDFQTTEDFDWVKMRLSDWHGWTHDRSVFLYHDQGPMVVVDEASGPASRRAAITWHLVAAQAQAPDRFLLREDDNPVAVQLLTLDDGAYQFETQVADDGILDTMVDADGSINLVTVFLPDEWVEAEISLDTQEYVLSILAPDSKKLELTLDGLGEEQS